MSIRADSPENIERHNRILASVRETKNRQLDRDIERLLCVANSLEYQIECYLRLELPDESHVRMLRNRYYDSHRQALPSSEGAKP
jgi:hypothetical protein